MRVYIQKSKVPTHLALREALAAKGIEIKAVKFFFLPLPRGIVLIHFPDSCVGTPSTWKMIIKLSLFVTSIFLARICSSPIVWEVNNIRSHEQYFPVFEKMLMGIFTRSLAGIIHNSEASMHEAIETYPSLSAVPLAIIPESNFRHVYPKRGDGFHGRKIMEVEDNDIVLLSFGLIRRYKGADTLIKIFKQINIPNVRLVIAGAPDDLVYANELQKAAHPDPRIRLIFREISHAEVPHIYAATTLHCAPFRAVLNSATVLLALSFDCPVFASRLGTMPDLERKVGKNWVMLYDGELELSVMRKAIAWACSQRPQSPAIDFCDFEKVASATLTFLTEIYRGQQYAKPVHLTTRPPNTRVT